MPIFKRKPRENKNAEEYFEQGFAYAKLGKYTDAIAIWNKAIAIKPDYADAYYQIGNAYTALEQYADAIAPYVINLVPKLPPKISC